MSKYRYLTAGKMKVFSLGLLILSVLAVNAHAGPISLGTASSYAVLGEAGVTNTGPSVIHGDVGGSTGTPAVTGFPPGIVVAPGVVLTGSVTNFNDATTAYTTAQGLLGGTDLTGDTLGVGVASDLIAGVYKFSSSASLNGTLILDAGGTNNASWTFQIGTMLTTASASTVEVINLGSGPYTGGITWAVGSAATLGTTTTFLGTIISQAKTALDTGATIGCGRAISLDASVTLDTNVIDTGCVVTAGTGGTGGTGGTITPPTPLPEGGSTLLYLCSFLLPIGAMRAFRFRRSI
jgi:hypothetical protein